MTRKPDTLGYKEFNKLTDHSDTRQDPIRDQVLFDDENTNQYEEVLMGMEYELEELDELKDESELEDDEDALELSDDSLDEDPNDINADVNVEYDESAQYVGRNV